MGDNIIQLTPKEKREFKQRFKTQKAKYCKHHVILVDEKTRMLECEDCGAMIEPFDYMLRLAQQEENIFSERTMLKYEVQELRKERDTLKAAVQTLRRAKIKAQTELNFGT